MILIMFRILLILDEDAKFRYKIKSQSLQKLLDVFGNIKWNKKTNRLKLDNMMDNFISDNEIIRSGLFDSIGIRSSDDEFQGLYKGVSFKISETYFIHGKDESTTRFCGLILSFSLKKKIKTRTIVSSKGFFSEKHRIINCILISFFIFIIIPCLLNVRNIHIWIFTILMWLAILSLFVRAFDKKFNNVFLEDPKFSKRFIIYSSDQIEARYALTPTFMERFCNLKTVFGAKKIQCSFYDGNLMIAIETNKNLFEIGNLFIPLDRPETIKTLYKEIDAIYKIIDSLKLHENIGL